MSAGPFEIAPASLRFRVALAQVVPLAAGSGCSLDVAPQASARAWLPGPEAGP